MPIPIGVLAQAGASAGATPGFELLESTLISSNTSSVTFSNLNAYSNYKHLQIRMVSQLASTGSSSVFYVFLRFNGDSASNYFQNWVQIDNGSNSVNFRGTSTPSTNLYAGVSSIISGSQNDNMFGVSVVDILDFSSTAKNTTIRALAGADTFSDDEGDIFSGAWNNTAAVTSITLLPAVSSFIANSRFSLYGIGG